MRACSWVLAGVLVVWGVSSIAQTPGGVQPGRIEQDIRRPPEFAPRGNVFTIPRDSFPEQAPSGAAGQTFQLRQIRVEGNTALTTAYLSSVWSDRIGKTISVADLFGFAAQITRRYRDAGYILSQAIVPVQDIAVGAGDVRLQVLEGYISDIRFSLAGAGAVSKPGPEPDYLQLACRPDLEALLQRSLERCSVPSQTCYT